MIDRTARLAIGMALLFLASATLFWPGYVQYDSLAQYEQALSGRYEDWHPPIMAHLWALFGARGQAPMMLLQLAGYWLGFGVLIVVLAALGCRVAALVLLVVALWPPFLGWQPVVLKDTQMLAALLAATGLVAMWRLRERRLPVGVWIVVALLLGYAMLVRANAVFAVVPFVVMLAWRRPRPTPPIRIVLAALLALVAILAVIGIAGPINHRLLAATPSGVERTQPTYDLAGIAVRSGDPATGLSPRAIVALRRKACVRPYFWDPLGEPRRCQAEVATLAMLSPGQLYLRWAAAAVTHPIAYAGHRLAHLNSTMRWLVPFRWPGAAPPQANEPNRLGLASPAARATRWQTVAATLVETPFGWPIVWFVLALIRLPAAWRRGDGAGRLAAALLVSALALEGSFAVLSIASDLRYHLWPMIATAIAWVLVGRIRVARPALVLLALVLFAGLIARVVLPAPPQTYVGMLG
ncbi:hypothetical protein D9601_01870 [Sphingomonas sp. MA1305]|uniref:hypothetical protein n=1 Tax=Sphingomonas sp. MA1305 TaxID=2479204 RepID=UPI0018DFDCF9|nr:hypothetical protein [Sphingomonas sp. MA1305]MBI0474114.1 hypothetical protein [Sphingomonas sp. MA1305]